MAYEAPVLCISFPANADLSNYQYCCVALSTGGYLIPPTSCAARTIGVLQDKPGASGVSGKVMVKGVSKVFVGATSGLETSFSILPGKSLIATSAGSVRPSSSAASRWVVGIALDKASSFSASTYGASTSPPYIPMLIAFGYST